MNVMSWADQQLHDHGDIEALVCQGRSYSSAEIHEVTCRWAAGMLELGLEPGERVVLWLPNGPDLVKAFTAALRAGGVAVILGEGVPRAQLERILEETSPRFLISGASAPVPGAKTVLDLPALAGLSQSAPLLDPVPRAPEDLAQIVYTSGSSGLARGVGWTHGVVAARYTPFADRRPAGAPPRRSLCVLPLSASFGAQYLYLRLLQRMTLVLEPRFDPAGVLRVLREERIQTAMLVPAMAEALLAHLGDRRESLPCLGSLLIGGSTVSPSLVRRLKASLGVRVSSVYGLTELGPVARTEAGDCSGSLGRLAAGIEARLVPVAGETECGELQLRAPSRRASYLQGQGNGEWLSTGDLGYYDAQGELRLVGRRHERILRGGVNVYPEPLEEMLSAHPAVTDCAVVGVDDAYLGEEVVAWVVPSGQVDEEELLAYARAQVEASRAPVRVLTRESIPRNEGGKVQRARLREEAAVALSEVRETAFVAKLRSLAPARRLALLRRAVGERVRSLTGGAEPAPEQPLGELGLDSLGAVRLANSLSSLLGRPLPSTLTFSHPTVAALARHLDELFHAPFVRPAVRVVARTGHEVAIVGAACRLSGGVESVDDLWRMLREGACTVGPITRWRMDRQPARAGSRTSVTSRAAMLDGDRFDGDFFDGDFFALSPSEARAMDPQHRIALEVSWQALESAGYAPRSQGDARCGVFLGISSPPLTPGSDPLGSLPSMGVGRIAHLLDLRGPALALDTACSSGLVAVYSALQSLRLGQCDLALAGGVNVIASAQSFVALSSLGVLAPDGLCKAFDACADGFGRGEGCVMFVLKRLDQAREDRDPILAVIAGAAVNHDGRSSSLTAPSGPAQEAAAREALAEAGWDGAEVDYLEAHGSGTPLGDPIELEAAMAVYGRDDRALLVGSAKSNFGHLEAAAGALGLLKAALVVRHREVPAHLHFRSLHPGLQRFASRLHIPAQLTELPGVGPCRAAVTSLGMGGTNAVMLVEGAPTLVRAVSPEEDESVLCLSARTSQAFDSLREDYARTLRGSTGSAADLAYTSSVGREHFAYRRAVVGRHPTDFAEALGVPHSVEPVGQPRLAFLFTGQGAHWPEAGMELLESEPIFDEAISRCADILGQRPRSLLGLACPELGQAALFALEWSLAQLWMSWGIEPEWVMGHSLGEYVAACLAGVLSLEDGLRLVAARGALMSALGSAGGMLHVELSEARVVPYLAGRLDVAALNGPHSTVVSGSRERLEQLAGALGRDGHRCGMLNVPTAFHSRLIDPVMESFRQELARVTLQPPRLPLVSTVSGALLEASQACSSELWVEGMRSPVRFQEAMTVLRDAGATCFLEIGAHPVLGPLGASCFGGARLRWVSSLRRGAPERRSLLRGLASLYEFGVNPDWTAVHAGFPRRRVPLPVYPFRGGAAVERVRNPESLEQVVEATLGHTLRQDENLFDHGLDSLRMMQLLGHLERVTGRRISPADLLARPTVGGLRSLLSGADRGSQLVKLNRVSAPRSLHCFHPAGGQIGAYLGLRELVTDGWSLYAIQAAGLEDPSREPASFVVMVESYAALLLAETREELVLLGWSFGAVLAHAVAAVLESQGRPIARVIMIDPPRAGFKADLAASWYAALSTYGGKRPRPGALRAAIEAGAALEDLHELSLGQGWLTSEAVTPAAFSAQVQLHQRHAAMLDGLKVTPITAPVFLYWARSPSAAAAWNELSVGEVRQTVLGGDHYSVIEPKRLARVVAEL